jgi:hypothetical protein
MVGLIVFISFDSYFFVEETSILRCITKNWSGSKRVYAAGVFFRGGGVSPASG